MDFYFILFGVIGFGGIILGFIGYKVVTGNIIKDLERENEILRTDNERMRAALVATGRVEPARFILKTKAKPRDVVKVLKGSEILENPDYFEIF